MAEISELHLVHSGDSANIAYYKDRSGSGLWCQSLHTVPMKRRPGTDRGMMLDRSRADSYSIRIMQEGIGQVAELNYSPSRRLHRRLSDRFITRLVRREIQGAGS
jgi:hypothetical protein